ncbi:MAG: hypothetical protein CVV30_07545 [Methanomicrobiales archaeon HGW-Methanomicrobiales-1]|jgi:hypothetical protein|nr:MAG: hypothetical protein CVV30_07545 [Methanomicrobiales archaeon HGW-Methanomicrobiales-1]
MNSSFVQSNKILIGSILVILIIGSFTLLAYNNQNTALQNSVKQGMESTVSVMATQISPKDLAGIKPGDEGSEQYKAIVQKLRTMRSMDDALLNAYILKVNPDQTVTFLVDDLYLQDPQGSAKIGEVSTAPKMDILLALSGPTTSKQPYTTKYGSFMTAYAPIDDNILDSTGNTYAVLAIDVPATDYNDYTSRGGWILLTGLVSMILAIGAIFLFGRSTTKKDE